MTDSCGDFDLLQRIEVDLADVVVSKWRSRKTGLTVVHIANDGMPLLFFLSTSDAPCACRFSADR